MDTTVVFFPGMGYGVDRPLFYYARKQAQQTGSEVVCVDYPSFSPDPSVPAPLQAQAALPGCVNDALAQLAGRCLGRCVFVSKAWAPWWRARWPAVWPCAPCRST